MEVIVLSVEEQQKTPKITSDIDQAIQSLLGAIPYTDMSLEELRGERLEKYELFQRELKNGIGSSAGNAGRRVV